MSDFDVAVVFFLELGVILATCRIIIDVGLERGLVRPALLSIRVVTALVTTLTAMPAFGGVYARGLATAAIQTA